MVRGVSQDSPPPQRPGGTALGPAREYLERERRRAGATAPLPKSGEPEGAATANLGIRCRRVRAFLLGSRERRLALAPGRDRWGSRFAGG